MILTIHINTEISYEEAERIAKPTSGSKPFTGQKRSVTGGRSPGTLRARKQDCCQYTVLSGSYNGSIYLVGKPNYNFRKNTIEIEKLDYELSSRNFLLKFGSRFAERAP